MKEGKKVLYWCIKAVIDRIKIHYNNPEDHSRQINELIMPILCAQNEMI